MNNFLEIVPCGIEDAQEISEVAIRAYRDFYLYLWNDDGSWYINLSFQPVIIERELQDPNSSYFFLKLKGRAIGFMKLNIDQPLNGFEDFRSMEVERIYIMKSASRKGFGRSAIKFCERLAKQMNKNLIWLKSMDSSEALKFYEQIGFRECGEFRLDFDLMKPEYRGMKILMKALD